jgi:hypothetical protein
MTMQDAPVMSAVRTTVLIKGEHITEQIARGDGLHRTRQLIGATDGLAFEDFGNVANGHHGMLDASSG